MPHGHDITSLSGKSVKPRVAIVGCGAVVQLYYEPALRLLERAGHLEVVALFDPDPAARSRVKRSFAAAHEAHDFEDLQRIPADLAILASPPAFHAAQGVELMRRGCSVLCEKPLAASSGDAQALVDAAAGAPGVLAAGMIRRFFPATQAIRDLVSGGFLGEIVSFEVQEGNVFRWPVASPAYFSRRAGARGVLMDIGVHALDLLIWWLGEPAEVEYADDAMGGIEANCRVRCRFAGGAAGEVRLSRDCELENRYSLRGTRGELSWRLEDVNRLELRMGGCRYALNAQLEEERRPAAHFERSFVDQILNVLAAMRGAEPLRVPAADALPSLRLIDRCYAGRSLMPMGWLDSAEAASAARLHAESE
jgi:predicted dehydrogenase